MNISVLDLFAGCGGLSSGLRNSGLQVKWANENWKPAYETYKKTHPETELFTDDAADLLARIGIDDASFPEAGEIDVITGGPPCQGFSGFNRHRNPADPRNSLLDVYLGFVDQLRPKLVLLENVPGMLSLDNGDVATALLAAFSELGYSTSVGLLQAGYYGLPQNRWRTFICATAEGVRRPTFPTPTHQFNNVMIHGRSAFRIKLQIIKPHSDADLFMNLKPRTTVRDALGDLPPVSLIDPNGNGSYRSKPSSEYQKYLRDENFQVTDHVCAGIKPITLERIMAVPRKPGAGWCDLPEHLKPKNLVRHGDNRYPNRYGRLDWNGTFNTILTRPHPYWSRVIHPEENRLLSVRECARAQSFEDTVSFSGTISQRYKQIGNAVPPMLAKKLGEMIIATLSE
jgi:DNA (cytosine-5)-methyltransferase 1